MTTATGHLPTRTRRHPGGITDEFARWCRTAYDGQRRVMITGGCVLCDATTSTGAWTEVALTGLPHVRPLGAVAIGWSCAGCVDEARQRAEATRPPTSRLRSIER